MLKFAFHFSLYLCFSFFLIAEDSEIPRSVAALEGLPTSIVEDAVCAITGEYVDYAVDVILPGPEPLVITRSYSSMNTMGNLGDYWSHNHCDAMLLSKVIKQHVPYYRIFLVQPTTAKIGYMCPMKKADETKKKKTKKQKIEFLIDMPKGITNGFSGKISGRTDIKNQKVFFYPDSDKIEVINGAGSKKILTKHSRHEGFPVCCQNKEDKVNGNCIIYKRDNKNHALSQISTANQKSKLEFSWAKFKVNSKNDQTIKTIQTSTGKEINYHFQKHQFKVKEKTKFSKNSTTFSSWYLTQVQHEDQPEQNYEYTSRADGRHQHICRKSLPDNRYLKIDYYKYGTNALTGLETIQIKDMDDDRLDKVRTLSAPVGSDSAPIVTHHFIYNKTSTDVYDAFRHKKSYHYDDNHRLTEIVQFLGEYPHFQVYSREKYVWGSNKNEGNLILRSLHNKHDQPQIARHFEYDDFGNVKTDSIFGNITGNAAIPLTIHGNQLPTGAECYQKIMTYSTDGLNLILSEREPNGKITTYQYNPGTDLLSAKFIKFENKIRIREFYHYNENAVKIKTIVDDGASDNESNLAHVTERKITYITPRKEAPYNLPDQIEEKYLENGQEVLLKKIVFHYHFDGYPKQQDYYDNTGKLAYSLTWEYNKHGYVEKEVNAIGEIITRTYDDNDNLKKESGGDIEKLYTYDFNDRLIKEEVVQEGIHLVTDYKYDYMGRKTSTNVNGNETNYKYDELGRLKSVEQPAAFCSGAFVRPVIKREYDLFGNLCEEIDARGYKTAIQYNIRNQPIRKNYPDGTEEKWTYDLQGNLVQKIEKNGVVTTYKYDYLDRVEEETTGNKRTIYVYNAFHLKSTIDSEGVETAYTYDGAGRVKKITKSEHELEHTYDALGRVKEIKETYNVAKIRYIRKQYDHLDRLFEEKVEGEEGLVGYARYEYDLQGNKKLIQQGEIITKTKYLHNKPQKMTDALDHEINITYNYHYINNNGQKILQTTTTDPLGNKTIQTDDSLGRIVELISQNPFGVITAKTRFEYDLNGNLILESQFVYENGKETRFIRTKRDYNSVNQLIFLTEAEGTPEHKITQYDYKHGQLDCVVKPNGVVIFSKYDSMGLLERYYASDHSFDYQYKYNTSDLPEVITDHKNKLVNERKYDLLGQLAQEKLGNGLILTYTYDYVGRPQTMTLPDQTSVEYVYGASDLKEIRRWKNQERTYTHYEQTHNLSGNPKLELLISGRTSKYSYDKLGRLVEVKNESVSQTIPEQGFDVVGNLITYQDESVDRKFTYDDLYQLKEEKGYLEHTYQYDSVSSRVVKDGNQVQFNHLNQCVDQDYDKNGNLEFKTIKGEQVKFGYDALGRLVKVDDIEYIYDSFNRRIIKRGDGNPDQNFLYQGQHEIGFVKDGKIVQLKIVKPGDRGKSLAMELEDQVYEPLHDLFGNVIGINDLQGTEIERYHFSAFGEEEDVKENMNPWRFADRRMEEESGLVAFGLRYYDPAKGQWITPDPLEYEDGPNLYAYVHANPLIYYDAYGLFGEFLFGSSESSKSKDPWASDYFNDGIYSRAQGESLNGAWNGFWEPINTSYELASRSQQLASNIWNSGFGANNAEYIITESYYCAGCIAGIAANVLPVARVAQAGKVFAVGAFQGLKFVGRKLAGSTIKSELSLTALATEQIFGQKILSFASDKGLTIAGNLTGYTKHGLNQTIGRNFGRGVNARAILDALKHPKDIIMQAKGSKKFIGKEATVILSPQGKLITAYGRARGPQIWDASGIIQP